MITFQEIVRKLSEFWEKQGCIIHQGYDQEVGAGTFNPATFLRCLGPEPYNAGYIEPCRRPSDGRYGKNPNRIQHYFQYQIVLKPSPLNIQDLYLESLEAIGVDLSEHDIRFVHDDWESPTLGAWGLGWEVWMDGMEVTQFTYFQQVGGIDLKPVMGELTIGIERLAMYLQEKDSIFDLQWNEHLTYGDIYHRNEVEWSYYNFEKADTDMWFRLFDDYEKEAKAMMEAELPLPAYDFVMKASHAFNLLDARGVISVSERTGYIARIRDLSCRIAESYLLSREEQGFPLMNRFPNVHSEIPEAPPLSKELQEASPDQTEDFILEIGSEELPATFVPIGCQNLENGLRKILKEANIPFKDIQSNGTPRRITVTIQDLAMGKPEQVDERRGPAIQAAFDSNGEIQPAGKGFLRSINKEPVSLDDIKSGKEASLSIRKVKGSEYLFAEVQIPGQSTGAILAEQLPKLIMNLDFPKKMRWADLDITYARPLRWIVALLGSHVIPFRVGNLISGRESRGHRQLDKQKIPLSHANEYFSKLKEHKVLVDIKERRNAIVEQLDTLEKDLNCQIIERDIVIPLVIHMVEWPQCTPAEFNPDFLKAPKEVLISEMVEHQFYFPVANTDGTLQNRIIITADNTPTELIRHGNQKVLSARLSDGVFLYEKDLKMPLEEFNEKLKHVTYLKGMGNMYEKVQRIRKHANTLQKSLQIGDLTMIDRAAELCKADLASGMVYEFPDLQGTIGRYYAEAQGEKPEVAQAIEEHWMPRGEKAPLPETATGTIVSLSDKIDNLISCFVVGLRPTSSSDPYALRRQTIGLIKILIEGKYRLPLHQTFQNCLDHFPKTENPDALLGDLEEFIINRVRTVFQDYGLTKEEIEASLSTGFSDIYDAYCKVQALHRFRESGDQFLQLYEVYKRARGQLNKQEAKTFNQALLSEKAEKELNNVLDQTHADFEKSLTSQDYDGAYQLIAKLQPPLATLFDEVKILADDPKLQDNRIALLQRVFGLFGQLIDFSKIREK